MARRAIAIIAYNHCKYNRNVIFVSGGCPKGGVDIWARQELAPVFVDDFIEFTPQVEQWYDLPLGNGKFARGYRFRNLEMAKIADYLYCIEPEWEEWMPPMYREPYHGLNVDYLGKYFRRSGGYWTLNEAKKRGAKTEVLII